MVHESKAVVRLVELFRESGVGMAVVLDEYGAVEGLVTPADVLTAIAGELSDDSDETAAETVQRARWLVAGRRPHGDPSRSSACSGGGTSRQMATTRLLRGWSCGSSAACPGRATGFAGSLQSKWSTWTAAGSTAC